MLCCCAVVMFVLFAVCILHVWFAFDVFAPALLCLFFLMRLCVVVFDVLLLCCLFCLVMVLCCFCYVPRVCVLLLRFASDVSVSALCCPFFRCLCCVCV